MTIYMITLNRTSMKTKLTIGIIVLAVGLLAPQIISAQGTVYLSNLSQSSTGSLPVGSDSWYAALFFTGNNADGYALNSIQLEMTDASGNPDGFTAMIYSINPFAFIPGNNLDTLNGSLNPLTADTYTYIPTSNLTLLPNKYYLIVLTSGTAVVNGAYNWSLAGANSYNPSDGWNTGAIATSSNGSSWSGFVADYPQFAINATAVPEPTGLGLLALGCIVFAWRRLKAKVSQNG
jgi:hypothetical protein